MRRKRIKLASYRTPARAKRYLSALQSAFPRVAFHIVPGPSIVAFRFAILANTPDGKAAWVARVPLARIGEALA